jgi:hypothetical protein
MSPSELATAAISQAALKWRTVDRKNMGLRTCDTEDVFLQDYTLGKTTELTVDNSEGSRGLVQLGLLRTLDKDAQISALGKLKFATCAQPASRFGLMFANDCSPHEAQRKRGGHALIACGLRFQFATLYVHVLACSPSGSISLDPTEEVRVCLAAGSVVVL